MQSVYLQRIMKKNAAKGYEKTKPKQTQFKSIKANFSAYQTQTKPISEWEGILHPAESTGGRIVLWLSS